MHLNFADYSERTLTGIVHNYSGLLAVRWFLGVAEVGIIYYTSRYILTDNSLRPVFFLQVYVVSLI